MSKKISALFTAALLLPVMAFADNTVNPNELLYISNNTSHPITVTIQLCSGQQCYAPEPSPDIKNPVTIDPNTAVAITQDQFTIASTSYLAAMSVTGTDGTPYYVGSRPNCAFSGQGLEDGKNMMQFNDLNVVGSKSAALSCNMVTAGFGI